MSPVTCHLSPIMCHLSPTATATDPHPANFPTMHYALLIMYNAQYNQKSSLKKISENMKTAIFNRKYNMYLKI